MCRWFRCPKATPQILRFLEKSSGKILNLLLIDIFNPVSGFIHDSCGLSLQCGLRFNHIKRNQIALHDNQVASVKTTIKACYHRFFVASILSHREQGLEICDVDRLQSGFILVQNLEPILLWFSFDFSLLFFLLLFDEIFRFRRSGAFFRTSKQNLIGII